MPDNILLTVTPGLVANSATVLDPAAVNLIANPKVELVPNGNIGADFLDMAAIAEATGDAATRNYLQKGSFAYEDWQNGAGQIVPANGTGTNAQGWFARTTGGPVTVRRVQDSPSTNSTWGAEIESGAGNTGVDFYTWLPPAIGGTFRAGDVTFSLWLYNNTGSPKNVRLFCDVAGNTDDKTTLGSSLNQTLGNVTALPPVVWTRLHLTLSAGDLALQQGSAWGVRCLELTTAGSSLRVAEAQFEKASAPTTFVRPGPPPGALAYLPFISEAEKALGADIVVQLGDGNLRRLAPPAASLLRPALGWSRGTSTPQWIDMDNGIQILNHTGTDQRVTVPAGITTMEIFCWGAGAAIEDNRPGGVGGYAYATFPVAGGQEFTAMVGGAGTYGAGAAAPYGFGGAGTNVGCGGGGLTGLFANTTPVLTTEAAARALLIAGGGGGISYDNFIPGSIAYAGFNGGDTDPAFAGGQTTMSGIAANSSINGGGGGFAGGNNNGLVGKAGTSYRRTSGSYPVTGSSAGGLEFTARTSPVVAGQQLIVPGSTSPYYQDAAGQSGRNGLMVIKWS